MPIKVYQSNVAAATPGGTRTPSQSASLDVKSSAGQSMLNIVADAVDKVGSAYAEKDKEKKEKDKEKKELQQASDLLDESNNYYSQLVAFEKDYKSNTKGLAARDAEKDFAAFNKKLYDQGAKRFMGDAKASFMFKRRTSQMQMSSVARGLGYSNDQDVVYRKSTTAGLIATYEQKIAANAGNDQAVDNLRTILNGELAALNPGEDLTAMHAKISTQTAVDRISIMTKSKDFKEANRLLKEYKGVLGRSYDDAVAAVESARVVDQREQGVDMAGDLYAAGVPADEAWDKISKIKDKDQMKSAQSQYGTLWTMQTRINEQNFQEGAILYRDKVDNIAATDLAGAEAMVLGMPETSETERRIKSNTQTRLNQWKASGGIEPLTDSASYIGIRDDIIAGRLNTKEEIQADERAAAVTENDIKQDLIGLLEETQKTTDKSINDAGKSTYGVKVWNNMGPEKKFNIIKALKANVKETNRGQDTDYIQQSMDAHAITGKYEIRQEGLAEIKRWATNLGGGDTLVEGIESGKITMQSLDDSLGTDKPVWLPTRVPASFDIKWNDSTIFNQKAWKHLHGKNAKKAAYAKWLLSTISPKEK